MLSPPALRPDRPRRCRKFATDGGGPIAPHRILPISMPSSRDRCANRAGRSFTTLKSGFRLLSEFAGKLRECGQNSFGTPSRSLRSRNRQRSIRPWNNCLESVICCCRAGAYKGNPQSRARRNLMVTSSLRKTFILNLCVLADSF